MGKKTGILAGALCLLMLSGSACAQTTAKAAAVIEMKTGRILYAFNEREALPMASTTKVMTALLALENGNLDDPVTAGEAAYGVPGTSIYLSRGETLTLEQMLYGLMISSGNDAAAAIAEHIGGSLEGFARMMNERAQTLGAKDTHFVTPHGLPAQDHYTTALDLARIAREAMKNPVFREIVSTQRASIPWEGRTYYRVLKNKNRLLSTYEGATGIKTGYTKAAGRCLVFGSIREGMEIVGVVLNCGNWFEEAARLMDRVHEEYEWSVFLADGTECGEIQVLNGKKESVEICVQGELSAPVKSGERAEIIYELSDSVTAPLPAGFQVGKAALLLEGEETVCAALVLKEPAERAEGNLEKIGRCWLMGKYALQ